MTSEDVGELRSKLDLLIERLGTMKASVEKHEVILDGNGTIGLVGKVDVIWRTWVWLLCALSGGVGSLATFLLMRG